MTAQQPADHDPPNPVTRHRRRRTYQTVGAVLSGTVLVIGNLLALFYTVNSWLVVPSGIGDVNMLDGAWFTAFVGTFFALAIMLLTVLPVAAGWLGKRWYLVPAALLIAATTRLVYINTAYPGWSDYLKSG